MSEVPHDEPLSNIPDEAETRTGMSSSPFSEAQPTSETPRKRRSWLPFVINWPALLLIVALIVVTVVVLLLNQGVLPTDIVTWWPLALLFPAALWFLVALLSRDARGLLGSAALFGLSASLLVGFQKLEFLPTVVGITFIATGAGIMLRGLLLRNQPIT